MSARIEELTCICCPKGCPVRVEIRDGNIASVSGNSCMKGYEYACKEVTHPTRIVTSSVWVKGSGKRLISVKTKTDIPKEKITDCINALKGVTVDAPVRIGDVIVKDVCGTGVDIVATSNADLAARERDEDV